MVMIGSAGMFTTAATLHDVVRAGLRPAAVDRSQTIIDDHRDVREVDVSIPCHATGLGVGG
jgi:hypothetical protein